ncbi:MAG TPA: STAS domain-containing protein [Acidimicrobiia bacterium]|jgi:anti-sigma B factor antagonist
MRIVGFPSNVDSHGLSCDVASADGETVVAVAGELDLATAPLLAGVVDGLHDPGVDTVVLDVTDLEFCDSSGLAVLVRSHHAAEEHGVRIVLRSPPPAMRSLLEITRLQYLIEPGDSDGRAPRSAIGRPGWSA